ncbi:MAG: OmpA family protein [Saprospiraceae bacterium]|nr:OmpA family protein [Saprospiraceae bacterium]
MRILLSLVFVFGIILGGNGQTEVDTTQQEQPSIIQIDLEDKNLSINDIEIDQNNRLIVATDKMLLTISSIGNENEQYLNYLQDTYLSCATTDNKNNIYAAGKNHLYLVNSSQKVTISDPEVKIKDLAYERGKLWLATNKGLYVYILSSGNWKEYNTSNSKLKSNGVNFVQVDGAGIIWVGTEKGYVKIDVDKWESEDKKFNVVSSQHNKEGQWMVATNDMWLIDPFNRKYVVGLDRNLYQGVINDFVIDSKGRIYMASDILVRYNPYKEEIEKYGEDLGLLTQKCLSLACDKNNNIWIGTADAGLFRILFDDIAREQLTSSIILERAISCNNKSDGVLKVTAGGGTKPYKYKWSSPRLRGPRPNRVGPGSYAVTVSDKFGSQYISEVTLFEPDPIEISLVETKRITGFRKKDGMAVVSAKGGTGKLTYSWSNGSTGEVLDNVGPGKYRLKVVDENNCLAQMEVEVKKEKYIPELDITKVGVGQTLRINELSFEADSTILNPESFEILDEVYEFLSLHEKVVVEIGGHTNTIPPHEYCDKLSTSRAKSVAEYITARGINPSRISYKGYGKRQPLTESRSASARKKNQRVEVKILSL